MCIAGIQLLTLYVMYCIDKEGGKFIDKTFSDFKTVTKLMPWLARTFEPFVLLELFKKRCNSS